MSTALDTYQMITADDRQRARVDGARALLRTALTLAVAYGDRAEAMAHEYAEDDPRYRRVALLIREAMK